MATCGCRAPGTTWKTEMKVLIAYGSSEGQTAHGALVILQREPFGCIG